MGTLTVRNLDEMVKRKLRERAASRGVSMEQQSREVITANAARDRRVASIFEALTRLGIKPTEPFDLKAISDEMWEEGLR